MASNFLIMSRSLCLWHFRYQCDMFTKYIVGMSLSEPHIDHDNVPHARNNGMYLCIYLCQYVSFTLRLLHPGFQYPCTPWNDPCILVYWCANVCDLQLHALDWTAKMTGATRICREDYRWRQVGECADTWYKHISLLRQWSCSCPATCQRWRLCESKTTDKLTVLPFCDVHIDKGATLNLLGCLRVICGCRDLQTNRLALLHMSSDSPPVFLECTSK